MNVVAAPARGLSHASARPAWWRDFGALMALQVLALLAVVPIVAFSPPPRPPALAFLVDALVGLLLGALAIWIGLRLGPRVGLGAPLLRPVPGAAAGTRFRANDWLLPAVSLGLAFGAFAAASLQVLQFLSLLPADLWSEAQRSPGKGLLASVSAGIKEEILFRIGLMTLLAWLAAKVTRRAGAVPGAVWAGNVAAALLFGAAHLPAAASVTTLTPVVVAVALVFNALGGVAFGWLYWRRGVVAAMVAHFSADIVLQVLFPLAIGMPPGGAAAGG